MGNLVPKKIVDKNGKATTVNVKPDDSTTAKKSRVEALPTAPAYEYVAPEQVTYDEILKKAKALHPDGRPDLIDGQWVITIETGLEEDETLPESFKGTPAWEAYQTPSQGSANSFSNWRYESEYRNYPFTIAAEYYNLQVRLNEYGHEWLENTLAEAGCRPSKEFIGTTDDITEKEREIFLAWFDSDQAAEYARGKLKAEYQDLQDRGF